MLPGLAHIPDKQYFEKIKNKNMAGFVLHFRDLMAEYYFQK